MLQWIMDLRLQVKVVGAAVAVVAIMGVVGAWSALQLAHFEGAYQDRVVAQAVAATIVQDMRATLFLQAQTASNAWLRGADAKQLETYGSQFDAWSARMRALRAKLDEPTLDLTSDERGALGAFDAGWAAYVDAWSKARAAYGGAAGDRVAQADAFMLGKENGPSVALEKLADSLSTRSLSARDDIARQIGRITAIVGALPSLVTVVGFSIALLFARVMLQSVNQIVAGARQIAGTDLPSLVAYARKLAAGDLAGHVDVTAQPIPVLGKDEFGQMAVSFNDMIARLRDAGGAFDETSDGLREVVGGIARSAETLAQTSEQMGDVAHQTGTGVAQVTHAVQQVAEGAQKNTMSAQSGSDAMAQLAQAIDGLAQGAGDQAHQVQAASDTANAMAASVEQVAVSAGQATDVSRKTREAAEHGARAVQQTVAGMAEIQRIVGEAAEKIEQLGELGERIGAVVETIDDIAGQTNLLALNAAIEAARAGEHGKGFAVVADEVRKLAERSQRETHAIAELIEQVQHGTQEAVSAMAAGTEKVTEGASLADQAGGALSEILVAVEATVGQVNGIATAAQDLAKDAEHVTDAMTSISAVVQQNSASTEEMAGRVAEVTAVIQQIANVAGESGSTMEEISASAEEMAAQVQEVAAQAQSLADMAEEMKEVVERFRLDAEPAADASSAFKSAV